MKQYYALILIVAILALSACDQNQTGSEKVMDNANDILDRRPGEKVRDAAEDVGDELKGAGKEIKETVKDATN
ncbi:hypothetical protein [Nitrosomonas sp.]|uniref:hypothetical protein n=1 Tax=Nitrosomonas sp. TaxID=42353 RepID=UPI002635A2AF|nr:hypothetical protein [Nitrosomonas sp.]